MWLVHRGIYATSLLNAFIVAHWATFILFMVDLLAHFALTNYVFIYVDQKNMLMKAFIRYVFTFIYVRYTIVVCRHMSADALAPGDAISSADMDDKSSTIISSNICMLYFHFVATELSIKDITLTRIHKS